MSVYEDDRSIETFIAEQEKFIRDTKLGLIKKQWVDTVYAGAESTLRQIKLALENRQ